jgi:prepilin-type N-terminal cleavage/methylation domain-containing protein
MRRRAGFTLVELLVVLFLLSVLAAMAVPSFFRTIVSARLRQSASDVRAVFGKARSLAAAGARERSVVFDPEKGEYGLDNEAFRRGFPDPIRLGRVVIAGEEHARGDARIRFFPDGTAEEAEVTVESGDGGTLRVRVDPLTGIAEEGS